MSAVFRKELRALLGGLTGWGFFALLLAAAGVSVFIVNVRGASPLFSDNAVNLALGMALACGLLCADAYPAERRQGTERVLYALPLSAGGIFLGKLLARLAVMLLGCALLALYPLALSLAVPAAAAAEGLGCVLSVCALGALFASAGLCCSALSRSGLLAFALYAALAALAYFAADMAARVEGVAMLSPLTLALLPALAGVVFWILSDDVLVGFIAAAVVLAPVLLNHLRAADGATFAAIGAGLRALAVFEPLRLAASGLLDLAAVVYWLCAAALLAVIGLLAAAARRQGKRRAL